MNTQLSLATTPDNIVNERFLERKKNNKCLYVQNRRYLGNKYKLLDFLEEIIEENCGNYSSFCE